MKIAQVAPLFERVPPKLYGGTERIVHALTEELVRRGHEVTLFATADSVTTARLEPMATTGARLGGVADQLALHFAMLEEVVSRAHEFDLIHSHVDIMAFPFARSSPTPTISTMHGRLDLPEQRRVLKRYRDLTLVSISDSQRDPVRDLPLNWAGTVHNGIRIERFPFREQPDDPPYLLFLGRISPEKGPQHAVGIARAAGLPLKVAAKVSEFDKFWAREHFFPLLNDSSVEFLGEVDDKSKARLLGGATALLFPIDWPEPFGIVLLEAMACGTPVVAFPGGAVSEVILDGVTGYVCQSIDEAADAVRRIRDLDRLDCRRHVERCFTSETLAGGYERVYRTMIGANASSDLVLGAGRGDGSAAYVNPGDAPANRLPALYGSVPSVVVPRMIREPGRPTP